MPDNAPAGRPSAARSRLLGAGGRVLHTEGIHQVGIDRIVTEAQLTRATLYRHLPGREDLVPAYLDEADRAVRGQAEQVLAAGLPAGEAIRALSRSITATIRSPGFRGCAFLNGVAKHPDPGSPVHRVVPAHRRWLLDSATGLLGRIPATRHFVMLRDGAMTAGCLFDPVLVSETFLRGVERLLEVSATSGRPGERPAPPPGRRHQETAKFVPCKTFPLNR